MLAFLVLLAVVEFVAVELLFRWSFHATLGVMLLDAAALGAIVVIVGALVCVLPDTGRGTSGAAVLVTVTLGPLHWLLTLFLALSVVAARVAHIPPPLALIFTQPSLTASLLVSIGIAPATVAALLLVVLGLHLATHAAVAPRTVALMRRARGKRVAISGRPATGGGLALAYLAVTTAAWGLSLGGPRIALEPVYRSFREKSFTMAPVGLMVLTGAGPARAAPGPPPPHPRPVVLIIVDALRPDRMGVYTPALGTTPFLSSLHAAGTLQRIDRAYGGCSFSLCGILGILTSRSWDDFGTWPPTVMDALARHRYRNHLILSGSHASFGTLRRLYGANVTSLSDETVRAASPPDNDPAALRQLESTAFPDPAYSFLYLHLMSAHAGSYLLPQFRPAGDHGLGAVLTTPRTPSRYDMGVRQADEMIRRTFAILDRKGMLRDAIVVITADHGERLGEDGRFFHGAEADERTLPVPLLIYDRHAAPYPARPIASTLDIVPTLLASVGAAVPRTMTGIPLQRATQRGAIPFGTTGTTGALVRADGRTYRLGCDRESGRFDVRQYETPQLDGRVLSETAATHALYARLEAAYRAIPRALPVDLAPC